MKLLDEAKKVKTNIRRSSGYTSEEIELATAWAKDEIRYQQVNKVLKLSTRTGTSTYCFLALALRQGFRKGKL